MLLEAVAAICAKLTLSPAPSDSCPVVVAFSVTSPLLLTMAAVSTPPVRSPPVPAIAVPLPTCAAVGAQVIRSTGSRPQSVPVVYAEPLPTRR